MPAIANISIADAETTPITHIFEPTKTSADYALWEDKSFSQYIGFYKLVMQMKRPTGPSKVANRNIEISIRLETPILETVGTSDSGLQPAPTVAYRPQVTVTYTLPERSTLQQRKNLRTLMLNALGTGAAVDAVDYFRVPY